MVAGLNLRADIWRIDYANDDSIGGAVITGSVTYWDVPLRMETTQPMQVFLEQGLETPRMFTGVVIPGTLDIRERDELEIRAPRDHWDFGKRFRITAVQHSSHSPRDPRNYLILTMTRSDRAHARQ